MSYHYIESFKKLGFGLFVHYGLYSVQGQGEWYLSTPEADQAAYNGLMARFCPEPDWAKRLARTARKAGCKYINLTTRHHDGFSLYDTRGLTDFDAPHACGRDLVAEFVEACRAEGLVPFFYHTLLDWQHPDYAHSFSQYMDYLVESVELLCTRYGPVGGFWFDGKWDKEADWQEDRLYGMIRRLQPEAIIVNNTGLDALGQTGHPEIDSVTFERGKPFPVDRPGKPIAGEVCQGINDHWGCAQEDLCTKSFGELLETLIDCRVCGCNFLLNAGPLADGSLEAGEEALLLKLGKWIRANREFIYPAVPAGFQVENAQILTDGVYHYAVIKGVPMCYNANVTRLRQTGRVLLPGKPLEAIWLDTGEPVEWESDGSFVAKPFAYGRSMGARVVRFRLE